MEETIRKLLTGTRVWAIVGCSPDAGRDSHEVTRFLAKRGFEIIPINPNASQVLGRTCYPRLTDVPTPIEVVDIFRRAEEAGTHVDEAIEIGATAVWMQLGVVDEAAAARARAAGLDIVMNRCPKIELGRLSAQ